MPTLDRLSQYHENLKATKKYTKLILQICYLNKNIYYGIFIRNETFYTQIPILKFHFYNTLFTVNWFLAEFEFLFGNRSTNEVLINILAKEKVRNRVDKQRCIRLSVLLRYPVYQNMLCF